MLARGGGAQIIYSVAVGHQSAPHAGLVSPHYLVPPGYEHYGAHLRRVRPSFDVELAWVDGQPNSHQADGVSAIPLCLARCRLQIRLRMRCSASGLSSDDLGS
jgi:hypothetical protein